MSFALVLIVTSCGGPGPSSHAPASPSAGVPAPPASVVEISRDEAVGRARLALIEFGEEDWELRTADLGGLAAVRPGWEDTEWGSRLSGDLRVWWVSMRSGELGGEVILDAVDGTVYGSSIGIAN